MDLVLLKLSSRMREADSHQRRYLSRRARNALLTAHIMISVGLLGDSAGFLAVAIRGARAGQATPTIELGKVLKSSQEPSVFKPGKPFRSGTDATVPAL
jgi:hypothetical protein